MRKLHHAPRPQTVDAKALRAVADTYRTWLDEREGHPTTEQVAALHQLDADVRRAARWVCGGGAKRHDFTQGDKCARCGF